MECSLLRTVGTFPLYGAVGVVVDDTEMQLVVVAIATAAHLSKAGLLDQELVLRGGF